MSIYFLTLGDSTSWPQIASHPLKATSKGATVSLEAWWEDPSLCVLRISLPSVLGAFDKEAEKGKRGKIRQESCLVSEPLRAVASQELWVTSLYKCTNSFPNIELVNSLLPSSLHFFPLLLFPSLPPLFLFMTIIDAWVFDTLGET